MARVNSRPSHRSTPRFPSDTSEGASDQENRNPAAQRMGKGKAPQQRERRRSSLPTPSPQDSDDARGQKRKRAGPDATRSRTQEAEGGDAADDDEEDADSFTQYYDPNQNPEERRAVKKRTRALEREFQESRDDLLRETNGDGLRSTLNRANEIYGGVKQTTDATVDSRLLVNVSDIAYKKAAQLVLGDTSSGIDVDEFLSKCITFMRNGGPLDGDNEATAARRRHTRGRDDSDEEEDDDDLAGALMDWEILGRHACYPYNSRPAVPSFLLGPLSVEKKQRKETQRRARNARDGAGREARPEQLSKESLQQSDESGLTAICNRLHKMLRQNNQALHDSLESAGITRSEQLNTPEAQRIVERHHYTDAGGVSLFHFALNPRSFGQSVENLFYVSFLIKEGNIGIALDSKGLPTIILADEQSLEQKRSSDAKKHQAVFALDYGIWQAVIDSLSIEAPVIPHREEDGGSTQIHQNRWYT